MSARVPFYQIIDGVRRSAIVQPHILRKALEFVPEEGDILQMSYPKCGTHWMQYLTLLVLNEGRPVGSYQEFATWSRSLEYTGVKELDEDRCKQRLPCRALMTHLDPPPKELLNKKAKYVYVARNPWDCCVSFYHHVSNLSPFRFQDGTFDEFLDAFLCGNFGYGDYFDHLLAGYALKDEPNVFFITYEQLKQDTRGALLRLAYFLNEEHGRTLEKDEELLRKLLEWSTSEHMRKVLVLNFEGSENPAMSTLFEGRTVYAKNGYQGNKSKYSFVRKGEIGGWKDHFTHNMLLKMQAKIVQKTRGSDVMTLWKDIIEEICASIRGGHENEVYYQV